MSPGRPPIRHSFSALNVSPDAIPDWMGSFSLSAAPNTDLWRKPGLQDTSTAPVLFTSLRFPFVSAEVSVSADWRLEWDQGGLVIFAGAPPGQPIPATTSSDSPHPPPYAIPAAATKWVKVSLEFNNNICNASSVCATPDGADWSLTPLPAYHAHRTDLRVKFERLGHALWVYYEDQLHGWKKLREVTGFFWGVEDKSVRVGVYASRPASFNSSPSSMDRWQGDTLRRDLCVEFEDLEIF